MQATVERLLQKLWQTPQGQALIEADAAEAKADRKSHIDALAALEKSAAVEAPKLRKALDAATEAREKSLLAMQAAQRDFQEAHSNLLSFSNRVETAQQTHQRALEESAPPAIDAFISRLEAEQARLRHERPDVIDDGPVNLRTMERPRVSNGPQLRARMAAVGQAIATARTLKLQDLDEAQLEARFAEIWGGLPDTTLKVSK